MALGSLLLVVRPASAQDLPPDAPWRYSEVRVGVLAHDLKFAGGVEGGIDLNLEATTPTLVNPAWTGGAPLWLQWVLHPRAHFGLEPNLNGRTSQLYAGATWSAVLARGLLRGDDALEFNFLFGPSVNNGSHFSRSPHVKSLGSNVLFHVAAEVAYRFTPRFSVGVYFDHSSNGGFARYNGSLNDLGMRVAYRF